MDSHLHTFSDSDIISDTFKILVMYAYYKTNEKGPKIPSICKINDLAQAM